MIRINELQLRQLSERKYETFLRSLRDSLAQSAARGGPTPGLDAHAGAPDPLRSLAEAAVDRARGYGLRSERHLARFALRELSAGPEWERAPAAAPFAGPLTDPAVPAEDKMSRVRALEIIHHESSREAAMPELRYG